MYGGTVYATSASVSSGTTVTLTASGLSQYTSYSVKVRATETSTKEKLWDEKSYGTIRTYCPGPRTVSCSLSRWLFWFSETGELHLVRKFLV